MTSIFDDPNAKFAQEWDVAKNGANATPVEWHRFSDRIVVIKDGDMYQCDVLGRYAVNLNCSIAPIPAAREKRYRPWLTLAEIPAECKWIRYHYRGGECRHQFPWPSQFVDDGHELESIVGIAMTDLFERAEWSATDHNATEWHKCGVEAE